jgi:hypothetical protein
VAGLRMLAGKQVRANIACCGTSRPGGHRDGDLTSADATVPDLARLVREHWSVEAHHHVT